MNHRMLRAHLLSSEGGENTAVCITLPTFGNPLIRVMRKQGIHEQSYAENSFIIIQVRKEHCCMYHASYFL